MAMNLAALKWIVRRLRVPDKVWWQLTVAVIALLALGALQAHADALWDFYFGPDAVRCDAIGTTPEEAVAVTHRLQIAGHQEHLRAWFAAVERSPTASRRKAEPCSQPSPGE